MLKSWTSWISTDAVITYMFFIFELEFFSLFSRYINFPTKIITRSKIIALNNKLMKPQNGHKSKDFYLF